MTSPNQLRYLKAMGIPVWVSRESSAGRDSIELTKQSPNEAAHPANALIEALEHPSGTQQHSQQVAAGTSFDTRAKSAALEKESILAPAEPVNCSALDWGALQETVAGCHSCGLSKTRTNTVFGSGNQQAEWMVVGEAPGSDEDRQGQPFVGRAGQLLTNMLSAIGLSRQAVYIANVLKCRPPNNRDPAAEEVKSCMPYLERQIGLINPDLVLVVGRVAAQNLLQTNEPLARLRGKVHYLPGTEIPVIVTYHPAYLLRKPIDKRKAWQDLKLAYRVFNGN